MADLPQTNYVVTAQMQIRPIHGRSRLNASRMLVLEIIKAFRGAFILLQRHIIRKIRQSNRMYPIFVLPPEPGN